MDLLKMVHTNRITSSDITNKSDNDMAGAKERGANEEWEPKGDNLKNMFHPQNVCTETYDECDSDLEQKNLSTKARGVGHKLSETW